ncbi:MAG: extracellular matrix regulator RemB [Acutalibacteraceae bacterium]
MYLHLGQDKVVNMNEIIGIFDLDTSTVSKATRDYLAKAEKDGIVTNVCTDLPKSFIVCEDRNGKVQVYISQISSSTLLKRTQYVDSLSNLK